MKEAADWIYGIAAVMLFSTVAIQVTPEGTYQKYVRLFLGILLMLTVLSPLFSLFGLSEGLRSSFIREELSSWMGEISVKEEWSGQVLQRREAWLKEPLEALAREHGFSCLDYAVEWNDGGDWPQRMTLWVTEMKRNLSEEKLHSDEWEESNQVEQVQSVRPIEQIEDGMTEFDAYYEPSELRTLHQALAVLWQLPEDRVRIYWQR